MANSLRADTFYGELPVVIFYVLSPELEFLHIIRADGKEFGPDQQIMDDWAMEWISENIQSMI